MGQWCCECWWSVRQQNWMCGADLPPPCIVFVLNEHMLTATKRRQLLRTVARAFGLIFHPPFWSLVYPHYCDVIMGSMASQTTSLMIYSTIHSGADQINHQSSALLAICAGNSPVTGEFPAQMARNAENVSIWWHHHVIFCHLKWRQSRNQEICNFYPQSSKSVICIHMLQWYVYIFFF